MFFMSVVLSGELTLGEVAAIFSSEVLRQLKKECGGLQTLLRNQHQVFKGVKVVIENCVGLRL